MKKLLFLILFLPFIGLAQSPMSTDNTNLIKLQGPSPLRAYTMFQEIIDRLDVQTATGTNTYVISGTLGITSYSGLSMRVLFTNGNTASSTLNVNSLGAKTLKNKATGANLLSGDLVAGGTYTVSYDGTNIQVDLGGGGVTTLYAYTTTAAAAGTTTLTASSTYSQYFTGITTQTVVMPVASTLVLGQTYFISNANNTGALTVQSSGANVIQTMAAGSTLYLTCILTSGTTAASWSIMYYPLFPLTTVGDIIIGGTVVNGYATPTRLAVGSVSGYVLTSNGSGVAPSWQVAGGISGLTAGRIPIATSSTVLGDDAGLSYSTSTRTMIMGLASSGTNTLQLGLSGNGLIMSNSSGEFRLSTSSGGYFLTFYGNGSEAARFSGTKNNFLIGSTTDNARLYDVQAVLTSAWIPAFRVDPGAHTGITLSTPKPNVLISASTQQWATGALSGQANFEIDAETISFVAASTATEPTTLLLNAPIAGTNANAFVRPSALTLNGHLFFKTGGTVFGVIGSTTNDAAVAGNVGEEIPAIQSTYTNYTTTATYQNITSIALTAGDWDISAFGSISANGATLTTSSNAVFVISTTTASAAGAVEGKNINYIDENFLGSSIQSMSISPYRVSISGSTTYYLNSQATFTLGNPQFVGGIRARRIR